MKIESARIMGNDLILTASIPDARRFVYGFKPGEYEISPAKKKRSLNANAYAWKLINDIALAVWESPEDVYREALKNIPNICEVLCVQDKAVDSMERLWTRNHIGRRVESGRKAKSRAARICISSTAARTLTPGKCRC